MNFKELFRKLVESQELEPETAGKIYKKIAKIVYRGMTETDNR